MNGKLEDAIRSGSEDEIFCQLCRTIEEQGENAESVIAAAIVAERESRVPTPEAIERVAEGSAESAMILDSMRRKHRELTGEDHSVPPRHLRLLLTLLGIPVDPMPNWAQDALDGHHGTPAELVDALRQLRDSYEGEPE